MARSWKLAQYGIKMCEMEDGYLVYHPGTGSTHLVDSDVAVILELFLRNEEINEDDLIYNLPRKDGSSAASMVSEAIESLKEIFLIEEGDQGK